ncbi:MAG: type VI secretion system ATPase TssH [Candidatus Thiodiazotropha sp. (ex Lucina aurantia)]|nr:type VI secretion system ATPase TssH [Candidatus Thiodiazotropha sp. (ex Lucina pensylvanica)]MBT3023780.1 type VI secretion system ATPase TssH [Candidatus Thiodiazotropha taylori]MBV2100182.1 type VI secretion system ATPase TssH [Candidatus Thiodiazotropha sp. (ex Codakia orbicularis)]MBV2103423.1 type VI secretion system ATPase TssH [Candidatus Thiodiazotropha sp. (ex Lucina aurantia)]MBV2117987.1 type VI secretion system ATPase TssH [Candidatus Thiodiazotropha sp. (ex Lucina aurantia)]
MSEINRAALFGKLNSLGYKAIESATVFCKMRGNPYVELVHWFHQILQLQDSDLHRIIKQFNLDPSHLAKDITETLDALPRGSTSISDLSSHVEEATERGWVYGTLMFGDSQVRTGYLIIGILKTNTLRNALMRISDQFKKLSIDTLTDRFNEVVEGSPEQALRSNDGFQVGGGAAPGEASDAIAPAQMGKQQALHQFSVDLTERARNGEIDPIVGRDEEIRQIVDILMRRRQNNPILTGEAGVGKTAVVEGFALRIARGDVPPSLKEVTLRVLDVGLLQAGASMKGEFENRLKQVIEEVQSSEKPIILFIDEAHTLIGAGGSAGTGDAANLLKPALARGTLRTVAATTWAEYKKYIEKDPALTRRFQVVQVDEPDEDRAIRMMRGVASTLEDHHQVQILDEALDASVRLSHRYIPARQLPDKSVSLLDTTCARVAISQAAVPAEVDDSERRIEAFETELAIIGREKAIGMDTEERESATLEKLEQERDRLVRLSERWETEKALVEELLQIQNQLKGLNGGDEDTGTEGNAGEGSETESKLGISDETEDTGTDSASDLSAEEMMQRLTELKSELSELQGERPLILPSVDAQAVASVVGDWTGIPVGRMVKNEIETILNLSDTLARRVIGQDHALQMISRRIQTSRANLDNPNKPIGVFMLCGPSGVGKTETGLTLAESLYGGEQNVITINMSEFQEAHTVSTLKGAPPGYVGYGEGGILTEAVRRKPYSVVLLDEVEKAHPDVHEIFFQVFDKGWMEDGEGRHIDFKNTLILLTSNVGTEMIDNLCKDPDLMPEPDAIASSLHDPLLKVFPAALLGRLVVIPYYPLSDEVLAKVVRLQLGRIESRIQENHGIPLTYDDSVVKLIISRCTEVESGARMVDAILTNTLLPEISRHILIEKMEARPIGKIHIGVENEEFSYNFS